MSEEIEPWEDVGTNVEDEEEEEEEEGAGVELVLVEDCDAVVVVVVVVAGVEEADECEGCSFALT